MASPDQNPRWEYSYDTTFSNPVYSPQTIRDPGPKQFVALDRGNILPQGGFLAALSNAPSSQAKIIYTLRHGDTAHNEDSETWGKPIAWRYLSGLRKNFDPQITEAGIANATLAGRYLSGMMMHTNSAPRPVTIYSSPLQRCIETSMYTIKNAGLDQPSTDGRWPSVTLQVKEGLREWMGYGHGHNSDRHGSRAEIQALVEQLKAVLGLDISYHLDVPEQDTLRDETYTDVDRRVRGVLDNIFDDDDASDSCSESCVMLVLHGRSSKSFLRVLGHPPAAVEDFEMANCAVLPYRVTRRLLDGDEAGVWVAREGARRQMDQREAQDSKRVRDLQAVEQVRAWNADPGTTGARLDRLRDYLKYHADRGDPAADKAMEKLRSDLGQSQGQVTSEC